MDDIEKMGAKSYRMDLERNIKLLEKQNKELKKKVSKRLTKKAVLSEFNPTLVKKRKSRKRK